MIRATTQVPPDKQGNGATNVLAAEPARGRRLCLSPEYFRSVARVVADAADALQHAHEASILHRDVKPGNLLVDKAGQCWLIDFGLARVVRDEEGVLLEPSVPSAGVPQCLAETALTKGVVGTPQYMAPEQYEEKADPRSDIWGLGVTLYELLSLRRAFDGP